MFNSIIVPLDGSNFAEQALPIALKIATRAGACLKLVLVHSSCPMSSLPYCVSPYYDPVQEAAHEDQQRAYLDDVVKRCRETAPAPVSAALTDGLVVDRILEQARSSAADLIVMTTHGKGPLSRFWLGSVADGLLRHATLPILLMRPPYCSPISKPQRSVRHMLVPLDGSELAERILEPALELGRLVDARYTLVRALAPRLVPDGYPVAGELTAVTRAALEKRKTQAGAYLDCVADRLRSKGLSAETNVVVGEFPAAAILNFAREQKVDAIAVATHGRGGFKRLLLGSVADKIIRAAHTPVLVYRPAAN